MRPVKSRRIHCLPGARTFVPQGRKRLQKAANTICLQIDEFEAVRLFDHARQSQPKAAKTMGISRPTFSRILSRARKKIAASLVEMKMLKVEGGCCEFDRPKKRRKCA